MDKRGPDNPEEMHEYIMRLTDELRELGVSETDIEETPFLDVYAMSDNLDVEADAKEIMEELNT